jgi:hypothetical protein
MQQDLSLKLVIAIETALADSRFEVRPRGLACAAYFESFERVSLPPAS